MYMSGIMYICFFGLSLVYVHLPDHSQSFSIEKYCNSDYKIDSTVCRPRLYSSERGTKFDNFSPYISARLFLLFFTYSSILYTKSKPIIFAFRIYIQSMYLYTWFFTIFPIIWKKSGIKIFLPLLTHFGSTLRRGWCIVEKVFL